MKVVETPLPGVLLLEPEVFDVAVDLRRSSPRFGRWFGARLDAVSHRPMWIPPGFAHGFLVLSDAADFLYEDTEPWMPEHDRALAWNEPSIGIEWPLGDAPPVLAARDAAAPRLADATVCE